MALRKTNETEKARNLNSTQIRIHRKKGVYASFYRHTHLGFEHIKKNRPKHERQPSKTCVLEDDGAYTHHFMHTYPEVDSWVFQQSFGWWKSLDPLDGKIDGIFIGKIVFQGLVGQLGNQLIMLVALGSHQNGNGVI